MDPQSVDVEQAEYATAERQVELRDMNFSERDAQLLAMAEHMAEREGWQMREQFGECRHFSDNELHSGYTSDRASIEPIKIIDRVPMEDRVMANVLLRYHDFSRNQVYTTVMNSKQYRRLQNLHQARESMRRQAAGEHAANLGAGRNR